MSSYRDLFAYILYFGRRGARALGRRGGAGRGAAASSADRLPKSPRSSCSGRSVGLISDPKAPQGSLHRPRGSPRPGGSDRRRAAIKKPVSRRGGGDLSPIRGRYTDGAISPEGAVAAWARAPGTRAAPDGGGGQKRWVGAKVARCGEGSIRRAFAFAESVILCRFFYKDWTTLI